MIFSFLFRKKLSSSFLRRNGQILIPSLLVIPSLLIFVFLLFETAKLSREKIRQQFAVDSAVFIQMGDYTNLFNRTAYVNGAFPYRLFKEQYGCSSTDEMIKPTSGDDRKCMWTMLYEAGAIPKSVDDDSPDQPPTIMDGSQKWDILYNTDSSTDTGVGNSKNKALNGENLIDFVWLTTHKQGTEYWINWDYVTGVYQFYVFAYQVFGSIEAAQWMVFQRITGNSLFLRQSYYFNANTQECNQNIKTCADQSVSYFKKANIKDIYRTLIKTMGFHGKEPSSSMYSVYNVAATKDPMVMNDGGLFQTAGFDSGKLSEIGNGIEVFQSWNAPANYFNVDFNRVAACREVGKPCVHARISSQCPKAAHTSTNNCIWPNPTPKYQTRLYP